MHTQSLPLAVLKESMTPHRWASSHSKVVTPSQYYTLLVGAAHQPSNIYLAGVRHRSAHTFGWGEAPHPNHLSINIM